MLTPLPGKEMICKSIHFFLNDCGDASGTIAPFETKDSCIAVADYLIFKILVPTPIISM